MAETDITAEYNTLKNATERLSVKNARYFAKNTRMIALRDYLQAYADILEGKDEREREERE